MNVAGQKPSVAFLGLGIMGSGMARRIAAAGFPLTVYNRDTAKTKALAEAGAVVAATPAQAATGADVVFSMLADDQASRAVWLGSTGALAAAPREAICVDCSTVTVEWTKELAAAAHQAGHEFIDAPVTGSKLQASAGELIFLAGGNPAAVERVRPIFEVMGRSVVHLGPSGSGAMMKLITNFLSGVQLAALAEGLAMIDRSGLPPELAMSVITNGSPGSPVVRVVASRIAADDYSPNFPLRLMAKDLAYAQREAGRLGVELTTAAVAAKAFDRSLAAGHGDLDMAAVVKSRRK